MYHDAILKIDSAAMDLHYIQSDLDKLKKISKRLFILGGEIQKVFNAISPYKTKRLFFTAQWCWALGHIGILYQMIRWFKLTSPETELVLIAKDDQISNRYFLSSLLPYLTIMEKLPDQMIDEAKYNAVYFACPDGSHHVHDFMKIAERDCKDINLLSLADSHILEVNQMLEDLGIKRPYVAVQARYMEYDPARNVTLEQVEQALIPYTQAGYSVISTGLDNHAIASKVPSVKLLPNPSRASFLLSAACDQFIGSDSGAWTIPWAYRRPVDLINDDIKAAWIYP